MILRTLGLVSLLIVTFVMASFHAGVVSPPMELVGQTPRESGLFIDKAKFGMHQLVLEGSAFERGYNSGRLVHHLMSIEEHDLYDQLKRMIPNVFLLKVMNVFAANWFRGIDRYFEPWAINEMYGVSLWAPKEYDFLSDPFTRQIAYHGLHEVGQLMVDQGVGFACTAVVAKYKENWIVGRNFDFEGGDVFDREKIVKWVFPTEGQPYVSVIWAGMVGVVTGVNVNGLYISLNAAGSKDFARIGTPSTLVIAKVLQFAKSIDEALEIFKNEQMFITDIFVVVDAKSHRAYRIEKSPTKTAITELTQDSIVANHLQSPEFASDSINEFRKTQLTSHYRQQRGEELLKTLEISKASSDDEADRKVLSILRDKGDHLHLNNRRAIDALIAAHSVVYDAGQSVLYVSQGPAVSGKFTGYDLTKSFAQKTPVAAGVLPADPLVSRETWDRVRGSEKYIWKARAQLDHKDCTAAALFASRITFKESSPYHQLMGDYADKCDHKREVARNEWQLALDLKPAYARDAKDLEEKLKNAK